jgi:hypothetical protein
MTLIFEQTSNSAESGSFASTTMQLVVIEAQGTSAFAEAESFDVLPPRLWLSHSRAVEMGRMTNRPQNTTPEIDLGSSR